MIELSIEGEDLLVKLSGWSRIWALKSELRVPLREVVAVRRATKLGLWPQGLRLPGTQLPGVIAAGSYWWRGDWEFWSVRHPQNAIVINTARKKYRRIVIEVAKPDETLRRLQHKLAKSSSGVPNSGV